MIDTVTKPKTKVKTKTQRPRLHKVILVNDDYTPREFVVGAEIGVSHDRRPGVQGHDHGTRRGVCVVAVFTKDVAETKATRATDACLERRATRCCSPRSRRSSEELGGVSLQAFVQQAVDPLGLRKTPRSETRQDRPSRRAQTPANPSEATTRVRLSLPAIFSSRAARLTAGRCR